MRSPKSPWLAGRVAVALALAVAGSGCAGFREAALKREGAAAYVYPRPIAEVWPHVPKLLKEKGFVVKVTEGVFALETDPKDQSTSASTVSTRYVVVGQVTDATHCAIRFYRNTRTVALGTGRPTTEVHSEVVNSGAQGTGRDLDLEWELLQRADPAAAAQIEAEAKLPPEARHILVGASTPVEGAPLTLEQSLERETAKKRLHPAVWIPATAGGALVGGGVIFYVLAKGEERRLIDGDPYVNTEEQLQASIRRGRQLEATGITLAGAGLSALVAAYVLFYLDVVPRHPYAPKEDAPKVSLMPLPGGGGYATLGGTF